MKKKCEECSEEFVAKQPKHQRFCSGRCMRNNYGRRYYASHKHTPKERVCLNCNKKLDGGKRLYCSRRCKYEYKIKPQFKPRPVNIKVCTICGKDMVVRNGQKRCPDCRSGHRKIKYQEEKETKKYRANVKMSKRRRKSRTRNLPATLTAAEWSATLEHFEHKCAYCGEELDNPHHEHFVPAYRGGGYSKENIIPACPKCNMQKHNKMPLDWLVMKEHGLLVYAKIKAYLSA